MTSVTLFYIIIAIILVNFLKDKALNALNAKHYGDTPPEEVADVFDENFTKSDAEKVESQIIMALKDLSQVLKKQLLEAFIELDRKHLKLGASENAVFRSFIWWCSNELEVSTNYSTIASHCFISKRTAINAVKKLEEAGVLLALHKPTDGKHEFMKYKINPEMNPKLKRQQQRTRRTERQHNQSKFKANPTYRDEWPNQKQSLYDRFD